MGVMRNVVVFEFAVGGIDIVKFFCTDWLPPVPKTLSRPG